MRLALPRCIMDQVSKLHRALSQMESDGVQIYDLSELICYTWRPRAPVELNLLPNEVYAFHLMATVRVIAGSVSPMIFNGYGDAAPALLDSIR
jgi:hypothetical protein